MGAHESCYGFTCWLIRVNIYRPLCVWNPKQYLPKQLSILFLFFRKTCKIDFSCESSGLDITLKVPIATKVVCFSRLLKCF